MSRLANGLLGLSKAVAKIRNRQLAVITDEHSITTKYVVPGSDDKYAWDNSLFAWGNIFIRGRANPIKPTAENDETQMIHSSKYQLFMRMKVIRDAFYSEARKNERLFYLLIGSVALNFITLITVIVIAAGGT